ncbi:hypothetical protein [Mesorhizobium sp. M0910]|uniref:IS1096 element passenger TnpR family protein n=1 Tax=Mesorhizobium sp. M0910 TaxID=2957025 RepID=UPI00333A2430
MRYGSWEAGARSPAVTLGNLQLRNGSRFLYEYDLNIPWEHEVRLEERRPVEHGAHYPACTGGDGKCPPEDCGGPEAWMWQRDEALGPDLEEDLATALEFITEIGDTRSLRSSMMRTALGNCRNCCFGSKAELHCWASRSSGGK